MSRSTSHLALVRSDPPGPRASPERKMVPLGEVAELAAAHRTEGRRIVHCHGCFDVVHPGHLRYLSFARQQGDVLVVSLTSDDFIEKEDGTRPHVPQELRAETLAALEIVDHVVIAPHPTATPVLEVLAPDVYVKGKEYEHSSHPGFLRERQLVERLGGRVIFSSGEIVFSSTALLKTDAAAKGIDEDTRLGVLCRRWGLDRAAVHGLLDRMRGKRVLVVGDAIWDRYVLCHATDIASEAPMLSITPYETVEYLGGAAVIASHLRGLGAEPHLVTTLAEDDRSEHLYDALVSQGVEVTASRDRPELPMKVRYLVDERKLLKVDQGSHRPADSDRQRQTLGILDELAPWADAVVFADFGYGTLTSSLVERAMERLRPRVDVIAGDVSGPSRTLRAYRAADLLTPSEKELRGVAGDFEQSLPSIAYREMQRLGVGKLIVKMGSRGSVLFEPRERERERWFKSRLRSSYLPSLADRVVDPMGAGDALLATATLALAAGASLPVAAYLGSAAAAYEVEHLGNHKVGAGALLRWLDGRRELGLPPEAGS
jgi:rfaE bifunctional protein kinase chain/domain/rfaE bifunctional protein nucleotidyltransferase chain/domain